jgi:hypothetical protein
LSKRCDVSDLTCIFCAGLEAIGHLFFDCCIAKNTWMIVSDLLGFDLGSDFESVARFWLANKRPGLTNVISAVILWSL